MDSQTDPTAASIALVVDDHVDSAQVVAMMLQSLGYQTEIASDGIDALRKANANRPQLILLDINMPKLDGFDAGRVIKAQPWAESTRLIAVTGLPEEEVLENCQRAGFNGYLLKPVEFDDLKKIADPAESPEIRPGVE